jgi:hypothetical protein
MLCTTSARTYYVLVLTDAIDKDELHLTFIIHKMRVRIHSFCPTGKIHRNLHRISQQKIGISSSIGIPHRVPSMEFQRNSMELHMPIFYGAILWRFIWIFPLGWLVDMALQYLLFYYLRPPAGRFKVTNWKAKVQHIQPTAPNDRSRST